MESFRSSSRPQKCTSHLGIGLVEMDLSGNQLSGEIPPELGNLRNLRRMNISGNWGIGCPPASVKDQISGASELCP